VSADWPHKKARLPIGPEQQSRLRAEGLLAAPHEPWHHPSGRFHLQPLPFFATRRQRSDRATKRDVAKRQ
jgi:hypothetical protein